jgi:hypothetical protein
MPRLQQWRYLAYTSYNSGGALPIHLEIEVGVLVGEHECVVDGHGDFDGELAPAFEEGEPFALPLQLDVFWHHFPK